ncbi:MAG: NfeD family protein [Eubacteriaceae bacterium]|nr:NfeD family protein [Eubacteriaceae bacterium]
MDTININVILWILAMISLIVIEISTVGLYCVWFAFGALAGLVLAMMNLPTYLQLITFAVVSALLFFFVRPKMEHKINVSTIKTNTDALIGEVGLAVTDIKDLEGGQVKINGQMWSAKLSDCCEKTIPQGSKIVVREVKGVKLIIAPHIHDPEQSE